MDMMAIPVIISVFVGLVVGCASMAMWVVRRIVDKSMRQFDRGLERGRRLADLTTQARTWLEETAARLDRVVHDSGSMARVCCKETANAC
jgi:hypothetical protein